MLLLSLMLTVIATGSIRLKYEERYNEVFVQQYGDKIAGVINEYSVKADVLRDILSNCTELSPADRRDYYSLFMNTMLNDEKIGGVYIYTDLNALDGMDGMYAPYYFRSGGGVSYAELQNRTSIADKLPIDVDDENLIISREGDNSMLSGIVLMQSAFDGCESDKYYAALEDGTIINHKDQSKIGTKVQTDAVPVTSATITRLGEVITVYELD
jgi:hypothetical protein